MTTAALMLAIALYGVPLALCFRLRGFALAGASFLLGAGAIALHLFALSVMGIAWTRTSVLLTLAPLAVLATAVILSRRSAAKDPLHPARPSGSSRGSFAVFAAQDDTRPAVGDLLVLIPIVAYAIFALYAPPYEWDYYGVWGIKGRWFFDAQGIDWTYLKTNSSHPDYPLLVPLLFDFTAIVTGRWDDTTFGWIYVALCASFIAIARGHSNALVALAVAFPALNLWIGLAEAAVMAFGCAGLLFLRREQYGIGAVMLGLAAWSKNEGVALIIAAALALLLVRRRVLALWPAIAIAAPWFIARGMFGLRTDLAHPGVIGRIVERLLEPVTTWKALAKAPPDQPYLWLAILVIVLLYIRAAWRHERFLLLALLLQIAALVIPLFATPFDLAGHAQFSLNRTPHQIAPAAAFLAALLLVRPFTAAPRSRWRTGNPACQDLVERRDRQDCLSSTTSAAKRGLSAPFPSAGSPPLPRPSRG